MGFIETPYRKVENGKVAMKGEVIYLTAEEEDTHNIAQANAPITDAGKFLNDRVKARFEGDFPVVEPPQVSYMDVAPNQIVFSSGTDRVALRLHEEKEEAKPVERLTRQQD